MRLRLRVRQERRPLGERHFGHEWCGPTYPLGPPTVAGGMFFVGTTRRARRGFADPEYSSRPGLALTKIPDIPRHPRIAAGHRLVPILGSRMLRFPEGRATESLGNR